MKIETEHTENLCDTDKDSTIPSKELLFNIENVTPTNKKSPHLDDVPGEVYQDVKNFWDFWE